MTIPRWHPAVPISRQEKRIFDRVRKRRKLFAFLREHRHELFDDAFQAELEGMYRQTGSGKRPVAPALLAMVVLLQSYWDVSDAEAVELSVFDARWQLVLGCLGCEQPPFSQGALYDFRQRLIAHELDRRLLERTRELAQQTKAFDYKKLPKEVAVDSSPFEGAGRVEDTFNLLAHAARKLVLSIAQLRNRPVELLVDELGISLLAESSIKKALDINWSDEDARFDALNRLLAEIGAVEEWVHYNYMELATVRPLSESLELLDQLRAQDLEPAPSGEGQRIRQGVAKDRRISIEDPDMRHGHKTRTKAFNGYKRHVAVGLENHLIHAVALRAANEPEHEALPELWDELNEQGMEVAAVYIDRGYISNDVVQEIVDSGATIVCKPWAQRNKGRLTKADFDFDLRSRTVSCPGGQRLRFKLGKTLQFDSQVCADCEYRSACTSNPRGRGLTIARNEIQQEHLRRKAKTKVGRAELRKRTPVEHALARVGRVQGKKARYFGARKNLFDLRRAAAVVNLQVIQSNLEGQNLRYAA